MGLDDYDQNKAKSSTRISQPGLCFASGFGILLRLAVKLRPYGMRKPVAEADWGTQAGLAFHFRETFRLSKGQSPSRFKRALCTDCASRSASEVREQLAGARPSVCLLGFLVALAAFRLGAVSRMPQPDAAPR